MKLQDMEDEKIIELYWLRSESAITETDKKYREHCMYIARNILNDISDSEECLNDTYLAAWNSMPPERPSHLSAFLAKITKNIALKRFRYYTADKRKKSAQVPIDEISESVVGTFDVEDTSDLKELAGLISDFLRKHSKEKRVVFLRRYFFFDSFEQISAITGLSEDNIRKILSRMRKQLKEYLTKRGVKV
ncbi:MAG: sigma-70 family RNA polymerase sigma factor [Oscillospiraceae bacterium]|nr:sigma-70 family RNA polymerase sigma factor [Oscillospiraceae bacterium]